MKSISNDPESKSPRKINVGLRVLPEIKNKLAEEATKCGFSVSEHVENKILNFDRISKEKEIAEKEIQRLNEVILEKNELLKEYQDFVDKTNTEFCKTKNGNNLFNEVKKQSLDIRENDDSRRCNLSIGNPVSNNSFEDFFESLNLDL